MDTSGGEAACKSYVSIGRATRVNRKDKTKIEGHNTWVVLRGSLRWGLGIASVIHVPAIDTALPATLAPLYFRYVQHSRIPRPFARHDIQG